MEKNEILAQLDSMKTALESNLTEKANASVKNVEEKIAAINTVVEEVKSKPQVSVEEFNTIKSKLDATVAALDMVQVRPFSQKSSTPKSWNQALVETLEENKASIINLKSNKSEKFQIKDFTTASITGTPGTIPASYLPSIVSPASKMPHARQLFSVIPSETDSFHFYKHNVTAAIAFQTSETAAKATLNEALVETTVNLNYLAGFIRISKKMLRNFKALQSYLGTWLPEEYYQTEDVQAYTALSGAAAAGITTGSSMVENIVLTMGNQMSQGYSVNAIMVNGLTWGTIVANKTTGNEFTLPNVVTSDANGQVFIGGVPVYVCAWIPDYVAVVGDTTKFGIVQSEGLSVQFFEQDSDNVQKNMITARVEASVGFAALDGDAFALINMD